MTTKATQKPFWLIYFLGFIWALSYALPLYSQSSFIESIVGTRNIGLVFAAMNITAMVAIYYYEILLKKIGNYKSAILVISLNLLVVIGLMLSDNYIALIFLILLNTSFSILVINNDIFLESMSDDRVTGRLRTTMLTMINIAVVISPLIMGNLVGDANNYKIVYAIGGVVLFPALILLLYKRQAIEDKKTVYRKRSLSNLKKLFRAHPDILRIMSTEYALRFFYAIMVLYIPIYLHDSLGFSWSTLGIIFTVMLSPFIIFEMPAGRIADKYIGEKEMIIGGLIIMAVFSIVVAKFTGTSPFMWGVILFMTRVGAALLESMNETYFFKQVNKQDMDLIDMFRDVRPFAWLTAAILSWIFLELFALPYVFLLLAGVLLIALLPAFRIKDTK